MVNCMKLSINKEDVESWWQYLWEYLNHIWIGNRQIEAKAEVKVKVNVKMKAKAEVKTKVVVKQEFFMAIVE